MIAKKEVSLPAAAFELGISYEVAKRKLFRGELRGRLDNGRWLVDSESVAEARKAQDHAPTAA